MHLSPYKTYSSRKGVALFLIFIPLLALSQGVLFEDDFEEDSAHLWRVFDGSASGLSDYKALFGYDYGEIGIPPAPNSRDGSTRGVRLEVNNNDDIAESAGVSLFPKDLFVSGNFALRFDMWMNYGGGPYGERAAGTTEFAVQGLNHTGDKVIWNLSPISDGFYYGVTGEGGAARDYRFYLGRYTDAPIEMTEFDGGFIDRNGDGTPEVESWANNPPNYPLNHIFPSPPFETLASPGKQWVQGELRQWNGVITWSLNGYVLAELTDLPGLLMRNAIFDFEAYTQGTPMLGYMDLFPSIAFPPEDHFVLYDNVRVLDLDVIPPYPSISVEATDPVAAEPNLPGEFTLRRTGNLSEPLAVHFSFHGTATPGEDYEIEAFTRVGENLYSVTIPAGAASIPVGIMPIDDDLGELDETIVLVLGGRPGIYEVSGAMKAAVILEDDDDLVRIRLTAIKDTAYERDPEDVALVEITRLGNLADFLMVQLAYGGTASAEDYSGALTTVFFMPGETSALLELAPVDNDRVDGARTIEVSVVPGALYVADANPSVTLSLRDDDREPAPVLFADDFESDTTNDWSLLFHADNGVDDYRVIFQYDYSVDSIPPAPHSKDGGTRGLRMTVNKNDELPSAAAVNVFAKGVHFSGNYALRFDMYLTFDASLSGTTEHALFGINHSGEAVLCHAWAGDDGVWYAVETDGSGGGDGRSYVSYFSRDNTVAPQFEARPADELRGYFRNPPFQAHGVPSGRWVDVEVVQSMGTHILRINGVEMFSRTDSADANSGAFMLGHMDTFPSIGAVGNYTLFDNVRVVALGESLMLGPVSLGLPVVEGDTLRIPFSAEAGRAAQFELQTSPVPGTPFHPVPGAVIESGEPGHFTAVAPLPTGDQALFRIAWIEE